MEPGVDVGDSVRREGVKGAEQDVLGEVFGVSPVAREPACLSLHRGNVVAEDGVPVDLLARRPAVSVFCSRVGI